MAADEKMEVDLGRVVEKLTARLAGAQLEIAQYQALVDQLLAERAERASAQLLNDTRPRAVKDAAE